MEKFQLVTYGAYQEAASAMGLLEDVNEAFLGLQEAVNDLIEGEHLRRLFVIFLKDGWLVSQIITSKVGDTKYEEKWLCTTLRLPTICKQRKARRWQRTCCFNTSTSSLAKTQA
jgi:hypothetical protein